MWDLSVGIPEGRGRVLNAVALQNAVLCAECDVVSDSPHDTCLVCGSRSLFNIARLFGGRLPQQRTNLITPEGAEIVSRRDVLTFPKPRRVRRHATAGAMQLSVIPVDNNQTEEIKRPMLIGALDR